MSKLRLRRKTTYSPPNQPLKSIRYRFDLQVVSELANDIKSDSMELVIEELGSEREINDTKLVRAAVYLLREHSHAEIIDAIKQVKLNMIR